MNHPEMLIAA